MIESFPLYWPEGRPRTLKYNREKSRFEAGFARDRDLLMKEIERLVGGSHYFDKAEVVLSTNIALRRDGLPLANQRQPEDVGVAVYFTYKKRKMCFACDRWQKIEENIRAIALTIEALRGIARWGTGDMIEAAFKGFAALPAPGASKGWRDVLQIPAGAHDIEAVRAQYRRLSSQHHPDRGGDTDKMAEINMAWTRAQAELSPAGEIHRG